MLMAKDIGEDLIKVRLIRHLRDQAGLDIKTAVHKAHNRDEWHSCIRGAAALTRL